MTTSFLPGQRSERARTSKTSTAGALSLFLLLSACAAEGDDTATETEGDEAPALEVLGKLAPGAVDPCKSEAELPTDKFYEWTVAQNATLPAANGALVRCQRMNPDSSGYTKYRVLYKTTTLVTNGGVQSELPLVASGQIYVPPVSGAELVSFNTNLNQPILANTHGATGIIAKCGPSRTGSADGLTAMRELKSVVGNAVLTVPDYVGLGVDHGYRVPDAARKTVLGAYAFNQVTHPFVSIESEGRATIDLVRATAAMPGTFTSARSKWLVTGVSQGGHAALATAEVYGRGYGNPGPILKGAIAGAPASEIDNHNMWADEVERAVFAMVTAGTTLEYRDLSSSSLLNEPAITAFAGTTNKECFDSQTGLLNAAIGYAVSPYPSIFLPGKSPFQNPAILPILAKNSPGRVRLPVPVFIGQIVGDPLIRSERTDLMVDRSRVLNKDRVTYCRYDAVVGGSTNLERAYNHDANRRMFPQKKDGVPVDPYTTPACYNSSIDGSVAPTGSDATPSTPVGDITPVAWARGIF
jgi:hypothetical protein